MILCVLLRVAIKVLLLSRKCEEPTWLNKFKNLFIMKYFLSPPYRMAMQIFCTICFKNLFHTYLHTWMLMSKATSRKIFFAVLMLYYKESFNSSDNRYNGLNHKLIFNTFEAISDIINNKYLHDSGIYQYLIWHFIYTFW